TGLHGRDGEGTWPQVADGDFVGDGAVSEDRQGRGLNGDLGNDGGIQHQRGFVALVAGLVEHVHPPVVRTGGLLERVDFEQKRSLFAGLQRLLRQTRRQAAAASLDAGDLDRLVSRVDEDKTLGESRAAPDVAGVHLRLSDSQVRSNQWSAKKQQAKSRKPSNGSP